MNTYIYQYRREQRVDITVEAETEEEAEKAAERMAERLELSSVDDESDDPGELELIESY
jgi:phosphoribosylformylglycinamidine (FGAM) synthase PurS component